LRHVAEAHDGVGVAELTALLGLNHNAVRQHLAVLKDAGLILEEVEARGRPGRPRLVYRLDPEARGTWGTEGPYELLARLLAEAVRTGDDPRDVGRRAGRARAEQLGTDRCSLTALEADLRSSGFRPARSEHDGTAVFVLGRCPFAEVATADPGTVCRLHLGLAEGLAEVTDDGAAVELVAEEPHAGGCRIEVRSKAGRSFTPETGSTGRRTPSP
jgi:predicted ArsR family transcriptional regulator